VLNIPKVSLDPYRRESLKILSIFKDMVPKGEIEKASIDEAFLDLTPMVIDRLLARFPHLGKVPDDAPEGMDSVLPEAPGVEWGKVGNVFPIKGEKKEVAVVETLAEGRDAGDILIGQMATAEVDVEVEIEVIEEVIVDQEEEEERENASSWEDWALCIGAEIMAELRDEVYKRLHYTCSAVSLQLACSGS
jgi:DNA polymerase eta